MEVLTSVVVATGAALGMGTWYRFRRKQAWRKLARSKGLELVGGGVAGSPELRGELEGFAVRVFVRQVEPGVQFTVAEVGSATLTRPGFERDLSSLSSLVDQALIRAAHDAAEAEYDART